MGEKDVDAMLNDMTPRQFNEWMAFHIIEPMGEVRADMRAAWFTSAQITLNGFCSEPVSASSIMNYLDEEDGSKRNELSPEQASSAMRAMVGGG